MIALLVAILFSLVSPYSLLNAESSHLHRNVKADNLVNSSIINNFNQQISQIEKSNKEASNYTKQYKKRYYDNPVSSESSDYYDNILIETKNPRFDKIKEERNLQKTYKKILLDKRPKLVIIIDDISNKSQLNEIAKLDLNLTPSIFPFSKDNVSMIEAVNGLDFFMVHLPLEAKKYTDELDTIKTSDSVERIAKKIESIKEVMPKTKYINNHTGSKFTENKDSVEKLLSVLDSNSISFVDSRTTPNTALNKIAVEQNRLILYRDIFIDNKLDRDSLLNQINEGVKISKQRGYAILIAHPHKETFDALKEAKNRILKEVDIVYLNELNIILKKFNVSHYAQSIQNEREYKNTQ